MSRLQVVAFLFRLFLVLISAVQGFSYYSEPSLSKVVAAFQHTVGHHRRGGRHRIRTTTDILFSTSSSSSSSLDYLETVKTGIIEFGFDLDDWEACGQLLSQQTGLSTLQAHDLLARAWNWKSWAVTTSKIARRYIKPMPPDVENVEQALEWLQGAPLQLSTPQQLAMAIASDPVAYLVDPCTSYQQALQAAPIEYQEDENVFLSLVLEKPAALKNYYNCNKNGGGCNSECGNCWVSFQMAGEI